MLESFKKDFEVLRKGNAGSRFREFRKYKRKQRSGKKPVSRIVTFAIGLALVIVGIAIGWLPGPGGFVAFVGLAFLGREIPFIPRLMDHAEWVATKTYRWYRLLPGGIQFVGVIVGITLMGSVTFLGYQWFFNSTG